MLSVRQLMGASVFGVLTFFFLQTLVSIQLFSSCGCHEASGPKNLAQAGKVSCPTVPNTSTEQIDTKKTEKTLAVAEDDFAEFPYRLSCPGQVLKKQNYSIVLGYHIGMMRNWETVVRDQIRTLNKCGLGEALDEWFVSYSGDGVGGEDAISQLQEVVLEEFDSLPVQPHWFSSKGVPWEGTVMNQLREYCLNKRASSHTTTVVFYWHTKGTSRWKAEWRDQMDEPYTYSRVLYWRKYMEYFLHERPAHCIDQIVNRGALTCGVDRQPARGVYAGNFWAASCEYLCRLPVLQIRDPQPNKKTESGYFDAEETFGKFQNDTSPVSKKHVSLHQPPRGKNKGFYYRLMEPAEYAPEIANWGPAV